jgi:hypothetical protein
MWDKAGSEINECGLPERKTHCMFFLVPPIKAHKNRIFFTGPCSFA